MTGPETIKKKKSGKIKSRRGRHEKRKKERNEENEEKRGEEMKGGELLETSSVVSGLTRSFGSE